MERDPFSGPLAIVSWYCRICTTTSGVDCPIYEAPNEDEGTASLHMMLAKLFPSVFNESQVLSDKVMDWPSKICQDCKGKVVESYGLYELCTKSAQQLALLAAKQQTAVKQAFQDETDDPGDISMKFLDYEEPMMLKEEYDSDDQSSECIGFESVSCTTDGFTDIEDGQSATDSSLMRESNVSSPATKTQLNRSTKTTEGKLCRLVQILLSKRKQKFLENPAAGLKQRATQIAKG
ncbi:AGAP010979-PA-like protein [Anopheles sinensis]|uniref:AGAP010979-PA-like protein n=1 Tax=Anopheles sinensis TaxID=74873 RepID=A0A084V9V1_ANOSI|nr:AGAP010979-PA-like protein [Anopheles sinensis]